LTVSFFNFRQNLVQMKDFFVKSHGLGNDYIVLDSSEIDFELTPERIKLICDVHFGIGSDGILLKVPGEGADFGLRILNPDGSEAEKSGNGLRIFSKYLYDYGYSAKKGFSISTLGGLVNATVTAEVNGKASQIKVDMGKAIFTSSEIPVNCKNKECQDEPLMAGGRQYLVSCVSVGNPHCVVIKDELDIDEIKQYGPFIENHPMFPNRINVQFARVISPNVVEAIIWERGAGYTLASGSSSCAVAATVLKKGLTGRDLTVKMPGGELKIKIDEGWFIQMAGGVREIASGYLSPELIEQLKDIHG